MPIILFEQELVLKLTPLRHVMIKAIHFELPKAVKKVLLIVSFLVIFDVLVAFLGGSYLSEHVGGFLGKSSRVILSDLLFLEGAAIFAVGTIIAAAIAMQEIKPSSEPATETTDSAEVTHDKWKNPGALVIIIGAILIGLAITAGALLR